MKKMQRCLLLGLLLGGCAGQSGTATAITQTLPPPPPPTLSAECSAPATTTIGAQTTYDLALGCERVSALMVDNQKIVILSLPLNAVAQGDALAATIEMEATDDLGINADFKAQAILADAPDATDGEPITGKSGSNATPDGHHAFSAKTGFHVCLKPLAAGYVNLVAWSAASQARPGDWLTVESGYGKISAQKTSAVK